MKLVYLSPVPWKSFAQRPHKFVQWFHKRSGESVIWVDPYPARFPKWRDVMGLRPFTATNLLEGVPAWLNVLKPRGFPIEPLPGSGCVNRLLWRSIFKKIDDFVSTGQTLLAIGKPSVLAIMLLNRLSHCPSLYDAMDDFPVFYTGISRFSLARREILVAKRADTIWTSSTRLSERWMSMHSNVCMVRNALDPAVLPTSQVSLPSSERKIFGYVGTIASWFDWEWVCALAQARPNDEIRLIGPIYQSSKYILPSNIVLLPACDHHTALRLMREFDVSLIPFKRNALTASVDPIKYYEYRALQVPVISTDFGEMHFRSNVHGIYISQSVKDVAFLAEKALVFRCDLEEIDKFVLKNSWESRFDASRLLTSLI